MATSGSTDFNLNARDLCTYALKVLRVIPAGQTASSEDMADSIEGLNLMLKSWQLTMPNLWRQTEGSLTLTSATASYSLPLAYRLISARFRQSGRDIPMALLTREEYFELPLKTSTGIPTQYYFDPQLAGGTIYTWPVLATAAGETIEYTYQRRYEDVDDEDNDLDIPHEYLMAVGWNLAETLLETFGKDNATAQRVMMQALRHRNDLKAADREDVVRFMPAARR